MIRPCTPDDAPAIAAIYNHYVRETIVTFEEVEVPEAEMARRIAGVIATHVWLVNEEDGAVAGYAYAARFNSRSAYRHTVESTVYLQPEATGRGLGTELYRALLAQLRSLAAHRVIGGIALPNPASVALHERLGFTKCAHLPQVGRKFGRWIDTGYWVLALDAGP